MAEVAINNVWFLSVALVLIPLTEPAVTAFGSLKPSDPSFVRELDNITLKWNYTIDGSIGQAQFANATDDETIAGKFGDGDVNVVSDYQERFRADISNNLAQLTILTVQRSDSGRYKFLLTSSKFGTIQDTVELKIQYPAVITRISGNQTVNETVVVALICLAEGMPIPSISWARASDNSSVSFPLTITGKQDEGGYRCTADNTIGNPASHVVYIIVENYHPIDTNLRTSLSDSSVVVDTSFSITCNSKANPPAKYRFYKDQDNFVNDTTGSNVSVIATSVSERRKQVNYSCTPFNDLGDGPTDGLTLTVLYAPTVINISVNNTVNESDSVTLACTADGNPTPNITWTRVSDNSAVSFPLTISRKQDEGGYRCTAENGVGSPDSVVTFINVQYPADITHISGNQTVNESDSVTLACTADGNPTPSITWTRVSDNSPVSFPLTITGKRDEGGYRCTADNGIGNRASQVVYVIVEKYHPINTNLRSNLINNAVVVNESFNITCSSEANPPAKYRFYKNQDNFVNDTTGSDVSVITTSVSEKRKQLNYSCTSFNDFGDGPRDGLTLTVLYPPTVINISSNNTVNESDSVTLACTAGGNPAPNITWTRVSDNSAVSFPLTITGKQDEGGYRCTAENGVGSPDSVVTFVNVQYYRPIDTNLRTSLSDKSVVVNTSFSITCSSKANPPAKYRFYKDQDNFVTDTTGNDVSVITTSFNERVKQANYRCTPFNDFGDGPTEIITVTVLYAPDATALTTVPSNTTLLHDSIMTLNCETDASPGAEYHFYFNGKSIGNSASGVFNVTVEADGVYTCVPVNTVGTGGNATVSVTVVVGAKTILIKLTVTNKGCDDNPSDICEQIGEMVNGQIKREGVLEEIFKTVEVKNCKCASVTAYLSLNFTQSVNIHDVLSVLKIAAEGDGFGDFQIDPGSIQAISDEQLPTDSPISTQEPTSDKTCECSCKDALFGAIIGILVLIIILLIIYVVWLHKKGTAGTKRQYEDNRGVYDNEIALSEVEPSSPVSTNSTLPRSEYMDLTEATTYNSKKQHVAESADYAPLHPSTRSWEVARQHVTIEKTIGKGAFGQVAKGTAMGLRGRPGKTTVAVKMLKYNSSESDRRDLLRELDTMKQLKPHPHVIKLLGCVTETEPLLVLIEYVPYGDLLGYLRKSRGLNDTYYKDPDIKPQTNLTSQQLMKFAWQIADGMSYLSSKSIIHRDLAARNVLVGEKETCKVTDFGMARDVQQDNIYERKTKGRLPVKWTAYEALLYGTYTTKSDVWSYGIVLYEIFTIGGSPYPRLDGRKIASLLQEGKRMAKPQHVDDKLHQIMMKCWENDPDKRPTFTDLKNQLKDMENQHRRLINMKMFDKTQLYANAEDLVV